MAAENDPQMPPVFKSMFVLDGYRLELPPIITPRISAQIRDWRAAAEQVEHRLALRRLQNYKQTITNQLQSLAHNQSQPSTSEPSQTSNDTNNRGAKPSTIIEESSASTSLQPSSSTIIVTATNHPPDNDEDADFSDNSTTTIHEDLPQDAQPIDHNNMDQMHILSTKQTVIGEQPFCRSDSFTLDTPSLPLIESELAKIQMASQRSPVRPLKYTKQQAYHVLSARLPALIHGYYQRLFMKSAQYVQLKNLILDIESQIRAISHEPNDVLEKADLDFKRTLHKQLILNKQKLCEYVEDCMNAEDRASLLKQQFLNQNIQPSNPSTPVSTSKSVNHTNQNHSQNNKKQKMSSATIKKLGRKMAGASPMRGCPSPVSSRTAPRRSTNMNVKRRSTFVMSPRQSTSKSRIVSKMPMVPTHSHKVQSVTKRFESQEARDMTTALRRSMQNTGAASCSFKSNLSQSETRSNTRKREHPQLNPKPWR